MPLNVEQIEAEALNLPAHERARLAESLWGSLAREAEADPDVLSLTDEERAELDRRLADYEANPGTSIPWEEVRAGLLGRG